MAHLFTQRRSALERFGAWAAHRPSALAPAAALEATGTIDEMLPEDSRHRPVDANRRRALAFAHAHLVDGWMTVLERALVDASPPFNH